ILEWAKVYCQLNRLPEGPTNIKKAMKDLIPFIRFENLKYVTLAKVVHPNALLSAEELLNCFCNKAFKEEEFAATATV
uniref:Uncharacterized protein n=1 Tax=Panagrolaimus sp. PS1159 TaxID=55785 RepID=A0AC35GJS2_9BILA